MTFVGEEKKRLMKDIRRFMLSQDQPEFCQYSIVKTWIDTTRMNYKATLGSIRKYFSLCKVELENEGLIELVRTEVRENGIPKRYYRVVR